MIGVEPMTMTALQTNLTAHSNLQSEIHDAMKEAREAWLEIASVRAAPPVVSAEERRKVRHAEDQRQAWEQWPPYCCVMLYGEGKKEGMLFVEKRGGDAKVAAKKLTCFGGKREKGELPNECIRRECQEELGWIPPGELVRVCDLYVDDKLIAWFYEAPGPKEEKGLTFEEGRDGIWVRHDDDRFSPWHAVTIAARVQNHPRADFYTENYIVEQQNSSLSPGKKASVGMHQSNGQEISSGELQDLAEAMLYKSGLPDDVAACTAAAMIRADLVGDTANGIQRLPALMDQLMSKGSALARDTSIPVSGDVWDELERVASAVALPMPAPK